MVPRRLFKSGEVLSTVLAAIVLFLFAGCGGDDDPVGPNKEVPIYTIPDTTKIIPQADTTIIQDYDTTTGIVSLDESSDYAVGLSVGDIIIGQDDEESPNGFLRKVTSKTTVGRSIVLETEPATMMEAFESMHISETHPLRPSDVKSSKLFHGSKLKVGKANGNDDTFVVSLDCVFYDQDGDMSTTDDQIKLDGEYSFTAALFAKIEIEWFTLKKFETGIVTHQDVNIDVIANLHRQFDEAVELDLAEFRFGAIPVGGIVWLVPTLTIEAHIHGDLTVTFVTEITYTEDLRYGFGWANDFYDIKKSSKDFTYTPPQFTAEFDFEAGASLKASCLLYGVAGPYMAGKAGFHFESVLSADPCKVDLAFDLEANAYAVVGIECDILGLDYSNEYKLYTHPIGEWTFPLGGSGMIIIDPEPDSLNAPWSLEGPCSYSASGTGDKTLTELMAGEYLVTWEAVSGWTTPLSESRTLAANDTVTFSGTYVEEGEPDSTGTVVIDPAPDSLNAPWSLTGPNSYSTSGNGDATLPDLEPGEYTVTWEAVSGWTTPISESQTVAVDDTVTFTATYVESIPLGEVVIDISPDYISAPWYLTGPNGFGWGGYGNDLVNGLLAGEYTITWGAVSGWTTPSPESLTLPPGEWVRFVGTYWDVNSPPGTVTDIDGNGYQAVKIGDQWWMAENLKVTRYRNGDPIPNVTDSATWGGLTEGAYCVYDNEFANVAAFGRLYNWHAIHDVREIAPAGWHVPSYNEWQTLFDHLGGWPVAGGKMKDTGTTHWIAPNTGATNESGFSALPGGVRGATYAGEYDALGIIAEFWSSSMSYSTPPHAWGFQLITNVSYVLRVQHPLALGASVRCVKD